MEKKNIFSYLQIDFIISSQRQINPSFNMRSGLHTQENRLPELSSSRYDSDFVSFMFVCDLVCSRTI